MWVGGPNNELIALHSCFCCFWLAGARKLVNFFASCTIPHHTVLSALQINSGKFEEALASLDGVLKDHPNELSARVARGTARALVHNLKGAVEDFDVAITLEPR